MQSQGLWELYADIELSMIPVLAGEATRSMQYGQHQTSKEIFRIIRTFFIIEQTDNEMLVLL